MIHREVRERDWLETDIVIGENGCGEVDCVNIFDEACPGYEFGPYSRTDAAGLTESGYFECVSDNLDAWVRHLVHQVRSCWKSGHIIQHGPRMQQELPSAAMPPAVRWYAVWKWRRRSLLMALPIVLSLYIVSAVPITFVAQKWIKNQPVVIAVSAPFIPVFLGSAHIPALAVFMRWEFEAMASCFGPP